MKHLKVFEAQNNYSEFKSSNEYVEPNVSFISEDGIVYFNPVVDNSMKVFCTFLSSSSYNQAFNSTSNIKSLKLNGTIISNISDYMYLPEGEYTAEIELNEPTVFGLFASGNYYDTKRSCLKTLELPESITVLENYALEGLPVLTSITFNGPTSLSNYVFTGTENLSLIVSKSAVAPEIQSTSFDIGYNKQLSGVLKVPAGSDYSSWLDQLGNGFVIEYI